MRFAVLTDIHANLPALSAVLAELEHKDWDRIISLGDVIGIGPFPSETLELLLATPKVEPLMGNHDSWFAFGLPVPQPSWMTDGEMNHHRWVHAQLDNALRKVVATWPWRIEERTRDVRICFQHYALDSSGRGFRDIVANPTARELDELFAPAEGTGLVIHGHHHPASDIQGVARYVNPGSLGCFSAPLARYLQVDVASDGSYAIQSHSVPYDDTSLFTQLRDRAVPDAEFISRAFFARDRA